MKSKSLPVFEIRVAILPAGETVGPSFCLLGARTAREAKWAGQGLLIAQGFTHWSHAYAVELPVRTHGR